MEASAFPEYTPRPDRKVAFKGTSWRDRSIRSFVATDGKRGCSGLSGDKRMRLSSAILDPSARPQPGWINESTPDGVHFEGVDEMKMHLKSGPAVLLVMASWSIGAWADDSVQTAIKTAGQCTVVRANLEWQGTGITVNPGEFVCVAAAGLWSHGGQGIQAITPFYGPEGFAKDDPVNIPEVVSRVGALVGRIGTNAPFVIERQLCFIPAATGELRLSMNDSPGTFGNNIGSMRVQIAKSPSSSIPKRINLQPEECRIK